MQTHLFSLLCKAIELILSWLLTDEINNFPIIVLNFSFFDHILGADRKLRQVELMTSSVDVLGQSTGDSERLWQKFEYVHSLLHNLIDFTSFSAPT